MGKEPDHSGPTPSDPSGSSESSESETPESTGAGQSSSGEEKDTRDPKDEVKEEKPEAAAEGESAASPEAEEEEEEIDREEWPDGVEGGPVKSFLEHLEDLRWTIIKSGAAVLIAMIVCLVAATSLVEILKAPLKDALKRLGEQEELVLLKFGTNVLWRVPGGNWPDLPTVAGTNTNSTTKLKAFRLVPRQVGTNYVFVLEQEAQAELDEGALPLKSYDPLAPFKIALSIALYGGLGLASPFVFFFLGQFVVPALKRTEKRFLFQGLAIGTVLFAAGVLFCYFVMVKIALYAAVMFADWMGFAADEWRAGEYISFVCKFLLGMGLAFEVPVVLLTLVRIRLMDYKTLSKFRMYWVIIEMIFASVLTPPDPATMVMMAVPLHVLYEFSVFVAWYWHKKEKREEEAAAESEHG